MNTIKFTVQAKRVEIIVEEITINNPDDGYYYYFIDCKNSPYPQYLVRLIKNGKNYKIFIWRNYKNDVNDIKAETFNIHLDVDVVYKDGQFIFNSKIENKLKFNAIDVLNHFLFGKSNFKIDEMSEETFKQKLQSI